MILQRLLAAVDLLRALNPRMEAQTVAVFIATASCQIDKRPLSMKQVQALSGLTKSSISRNLRMLSVGDGKRPGLGLVATAENPIDRREKFVRLTPKGARLAEKMVATLTKDSK